MSSLDKLESVKLSFSKKRIFICTFLVSLLLLTYAQSHVLASVTIGMSDYVEIQPNLYVDDMFSEEEHRQAAATYTEAKNRVARTYGQLSSSPIVIISSNSNRSERFGVKLPVPGATHTLPWGQYIPLNDEGNNVDVLAHELAHAETAHRAGYLTWTFYLPIWFTEGVAMQVDYRERYNASGIEFPSVTTLTTGSEFHSGDITLNYTAAKYELAGWLKENHNKGLYTFLAKIRSGEDFTTVYKEFSSKNQ